MKKIEDNLDNMVSYIIELAMMYCSNAEDASRLQRCQASRSIAKSFLTNGGYFMGSPEETAVFIASQLAYAIRNSIRPPAEATVITDSKADAGGLPPRGEK